MPFVLSRENSIYTEALTAYTLKGHEVRARLARFSFARGGLRASFRFSDFAARLFAIRGAAKDLDCSWEPTKKVCRAVFEIRICDTLVKGKVCKIVQW